MIVQQTILGCGRFRFNKRELLVHPGNALVAIVPEKSSYFFCNEDSPEWAFRWITFEGDSAIQLWGELRKRFGAVLNLGEASGASRALGRLIEDVSNRKLRGIQAQAEAAHSVFVSCWLQMESAAAGISNPATILREMIRERYSEPVNIKQLCADIGQSREHLTRVFKKTYGIEPSAYLRHLRLTSAERYLRRSNLSVSEIALRTGHAGATQFIRSFSAANKNSPRAFRSL